MKPYLRKGTRPEDGTCGPLPACAPLAVPYIPVQPENPPQYEPGKGLIRGTMFPGLDLPFMGMRNEQLQPDTLRAQLQTVSFAVLELSLYLDTHREDAQALELYRRYQELLQELRRRMDQRCGPVSHQIPGEGPYRWLDDPWPWEYGANREENHV